MKKWYGLTRRLVERLTRWTETLFNSEITGQTRADTGYGLGQRFAYMLVVFNLFFDFFKPVIEIFENIMREFTCSFILLAFVNNDLDMFEIKFHLFQTQNHAQPRKLLVGITSKTTATSAFGIYQTHLFVIAHCAGGRTGFFRQFPNMHQTIIAF